MKNRLLLAVVAILGIVSAGCQSGRVYDAQLSSDGEVIACRDSRYRTIFVADAEGRRRIDSDGRFFLDPAGAWLLIFPNHRGRLDGLQHVTGRPLKLVDLQSSKTYETRLPFNIPWNAVVAPKQRVLRHHEPYRTQEELEAAPRCRVFFLPGPDIVIGPVEEAYYCWHPTESRYSARSWCRLTRSEAERLDRLKPASRLLGQVAPSGCVVNMPVEGFTPRRAVWVRPDGSVVELNRQNDVPLRLMLATGISVPATACFWHPFAPVWCLAAWNDAIGSTITDPEAVRSAREKLESLVEARKSGTWVAPEQRDEMIVE